MTSPQPRVMLWVDGDHVEIWCIGPHEDSTAPLAESVFSALCKWPGFELVATIVNGDNACAVGARHGRDAQCADPLAEAMRVLEPLRLDWQDITTRSAVATL